MRPSQLSKDTCYRGKLNSNLLNFSLFSNYISQGPSFNFELSEVVFLAISRPA